MTIELPEIPGASLDVVHDDDGYSAELTVERVLPSREYDAFSNACLSIPPLVASNGSHELRGMVSMDEETLWVYVHALGPGAFGHDQEHAAFDVLERLWQTVHERASVS